MARMRSASPTFALPPLPLLDLLLPLAPPTSAAAAAAAAADEEDEDEDEEDGGGGGGGGGEEVTAGVAADEDDGPIMSRNFWRAVEEMADGAGASVGSRNALSVALPSRSRPEYTTSTRTTIFG